MHRTALEHVDRTILENDLALNLAITGGADRHGDVVEEIRTDAIMHGAPP
jgi:hypothetical protein